MKKLTQLEKRHLQGAIIGILLGIPGLILANYVPDHASKLGGVFFGLAIFNLLTSVAMLGFIVYIRLRLRNEYVKI